MPLKKLYLLLLPALFAAFYSCQKDIKVLGEDDTMTPKTTVFIRSITLNSFDSIDPNTMLPWDDGSVQSFDSLDYKGPDIYYNFYYKTDTGTVMSFKQLTHFSNVMPLNPDTPLVYTLTDPFQIFPEYVDSTFYLRMYDLDYATPLNDSTLMDSIPFKIGPYFNPPNQYITSVSGTGFNGSRVTLGLLWK